MLRWESYSFVVILLWQPLVSVLEETKSGDGGDNILSLGIIACSDDLGLPGPAFMGCISFSVAHVYVVLAIEKASD